MGANVVLIADEIEAQDTRTPDSRKIGGAVIPRQRCAFPGCGRQLEFAPVEGVASSVGLGGVMRRKVCQDHPPAGACSRCGILAGPQYMVNVLVGGRCPDCAGKPVRAAVVRRSQSSSRAGASGETVLASAGLAPSSQT